MEKIVDNDALISAQVILKTEKKIDERTQITAENIHLYLPDNRPYLLISQEMTLKGFQVGNLVGISFSITSTANIFSEVFGVEFIQKEQNIYCSYNDGKLSQELPLNRLPKNMFEMISSIVFTPAPDFGPVEFNSI